MKTHEGLQKFEDLIKNQFSYGGKKYALSGSKESTDQLFDMYGKAWLFGTCHKYIFRLRNVERERDLLKIATYMFILWLKKGFFVKPDGLANDVLDTTVQIKEQQFPLFIDRVHNKIDTWLKEGNLILFENRSDADRTLFLETLFQSWTKQLWSEITEDAIFGAYYCCYLIWFLKYSNVDKHDEDTFNVGDKK